MSSSKDQVLALVEADPFISQQALGERLGLSRSAVAAHLAQLTREGRILGRAYMLPRREQLVCIGGTNLDRKLRAEQPLQMGSSNPARQTESPGGVARNIAENLARLGLPVHLLTAVGRDVAGQALLAQLQTLGVDCAGCLSADDASTGSYTAVLDPLGGLVLALAHMTLTDRLDPEFLRRTSPHRAAARWVVADLNLPRASLDQLRLEARARRQSLVLVAVSEPKMARLGAELDGVALLVLNRGELAAYLGRPLPDRQALDDAWRSLRAQGLSRLVLSDGAHGVWLANAEAEADADADADTDADTGNDPATAARAAPGGLVHLPSPPLPAASLREVTGAGDAMSAGIVAALSRGASLRAACRLGQRLAALTLQTDATVSSALSPALLD